MQEGKNGQMKERKKGCSLSLTFIFLFVGIIGHTTADSDDGKEEDIPGAALPPLKLGHSICALKADEGPCKAIHMRYYFNLQSRKCEIFEYGGCHGNENNFLTLEECQKKCVVTEFPVKMMLAKIKKEKPNFCFHEKDPGICRGYFSRYFYNKETKICEIFKYGGCLGNQNNFKNLEECQTTCQSSSNLLPIAPTEDHPNTVNSSSPEEPNEFPGFFVNLLPTAPNEEQSNIVNGSSPEEERDQIPSFFARNEQLKSAYIKKSCSKSESFMNVTLLRLKKENAVSVVSYLAHEVIFELLLYYDQLTFHYHMSQPQISLRENVYCCNAGLGLFLINISL
nr:PREDICTED: tissue factor pathway inhibitor isoform X3 [Struthio camelus australis]